MYRGNSLRYEKDMESRRAYAQAKARQRQKKFVLGPSIASSLDSKKSVLFVPMVMFHKPIWNFWREKGFSWTGEQFERVVPCTANKQAWLDRATILYYKLWDAVNDGKEWDENLST